MFNVGEQYKDNEGITITITHITDEKIVAGCVGKRVTYNRPRYDGKVTSGWSMLDDSLYAKSLIKV